MHLKYISDTHHEFKKGSSASEVGWNICTMKIKSSVFSKNQSTSFGFGNNLGFMLAQETVQQFNTISITIITPFLEICKYENVTTKYKESNP